MSGSVARADWQRQALSSSGKHLVRGGRWLGVLLLLVASMWTGAVAAESPMLDLEGMTFVASRGTESEIIVRARKALYRPDSEAATLTTVRARVASAEDGLHFEMTCDRGDLDLSSSDFFAEGNVRGQTDDGRRFRADWVRYRHEDGLLFTDEPVLITDDNGTYEGGGFRYFVKERRFRLVGGARVVQQP